MKENTSQKQLLIINDLIFDHIAKLDLNIFSL